MLYVIGTEGLRKGEKVPSSWQYVCKLGLGEAGLCPNPLELPKKTGVPRRVYTVHTVRGVR